MTREQKFEKHLRAISSEAFDNVVEEIARHNFDRVWAVCASELLEEFNNDAIDKIRADWELTPEGKEEDE